MFMVVRVGGGAGTYLKQHPFLVPFLYMTFKTSMNQSCNRNSKGGMEKMNVWRGRGVTREESLTMNEV